MEEEEINMIKKRDRLVGALTCPVLFLAVPRLTEKKGKLS